MLLQLFKASLSGLKLVLKYFRAEKQNQNKLQVLSSRRVALSFQNIKSGHLSATTTTSKQNTKQSKLKVKSSKGFL